METTKIYSACDITFLGDYTREEFLEMFLDNSDFLDEDDNESVMFKQVHKHTNGGQQYTLYICFNDESVFLLDADGHKYIMGCPCCDDIEFIGDALHLDGVVCDITVNLTDMSVEQS